MIDFNSTGQRVVFQEAESLRLLYNSWPENFSEIIRRMLNVHGKIVLAGIGKSGHIARKIAASLASTGTSAIFVHPTEAAHGDMGMISQNDLVMVFSNSGNSDELIPLLNYCNNHKIPLVGVTMNTASNLARCANAIMLLPKVQEASSLGAPTTSCLMTLALGDAITVTLHEAKSFSKDDYLVNHPAGAIGKKLAGKTS